MNLETVSHGLESALESDALAALNVDIVRIRLTDNKTIFTEQKKPFVKGTYYIYYNPNKEKSPWHDL